MSLHHPRCSERIGALEGDCEEPAFSVVDDPPINGKSSRRINGKAVTHIYSTEHNLYGYAVSFASVQFLFLVLTIFYASAILLTSVISRVVYKTYFDNVEGATSMCKRRGEKWDCRPTGYEKLMDFDSVDTDGNGVWTVAEARSKGLLVQFRELHDLVLSTPEVLLAVAPPKPAIVNLYCYFYWWNPYSMYQLDDSEHLELANASGLMTDEIIRYCGMTDPYCIINRSCPKQGSTLLTEARDSRQEYMSKTRSLSTFPRDVYSTVTDSLVFPCRLGMPSLCGNAESKNILATVPMWAKLNPEQRVRACMGHLENQCSRVLGDSFSRFQVKLAQTCKKKSYTADEAPPTPPLPSMMKYHVNENRDCSDNDTLSKETVERLLNVNPAMSYLIMGTERSLGLPEGAIRFNFDCDLVSALDYCLEASGVASPSDTSKFVPTMTLVGEVCPRTCCVRRSPSCPAVCAAANLGSAFTLKTLWGNATCLGASCSNIDMQVDTISGSLLLELGFHERMDMAKIIIESDKVLRVQINRMDTSYVGDQLCAGGSLEIDGIKYCVGHKPNSVTLPRRVDGLVQLNWYAINACNSGNCGWSVMIMDAGEPAAYSISTVEYEEVSKYHDINQPMYMAFFLVILFLWSAYILVELKTAWLYTRFIWRCPDFPGSDKKRAFLILFVCIPRLGLALWVCLVGYILLIVAPDFVEIVLNSVALAFILDLDEILFRILVPSRKQEDINDLKAYTWNSERCSCLRQRTVVFISLLSPALPAFGFMVLQYNWSSGFFRLEELTTCACQLEGSTCVDALLFDHQSR